ncbi:hypothetical protein NDU88_000209 [Pleurodeles waltl]|uniref:Uncharacterized protein n=1 Tax=Pleurodeles waltl TaxID=8319 RepID=A0AAV7V4H1_PLEWA|nr:hypothetical protein NDU88_000209 [Pleurodeles waltl]
MARSPGQRALYKDGAEFVANRRGLISRNPHKDGRRWLPGSPFAARADPPPLSKMAPGGTAVMSDEPLPLRRPLAPRPPLLDGLRQRRRHLRRFAALECGPGRRGRFFMYPDPGVWRASVPPFR